MSRRCAAAVLGVVLLAGCQAAATVAVKTTGRTVSPSSTGDVLDGTWTVAIAGQPKAAVLDLHDALWTLQTECTQTHGVWAARGGLFLARPEGGVAIGGAGCTEDRGDDVYRRYEGYLDDAGDHDGEGNHRGHTAPPPGPPVWFLEAAGYTATGDGWQLVDRQGRTLATLRSRERLVALELRGSLGAVPDEGDLSQEERAQLNRTPAAPLPTGLEPADADFVTRLFGFWTAVEKTPGGCGMTTRIFQHSFTWGASFRGFGHVEGSWVLGADGLALGNWDHIVTTCGPEHEGVQQFGITMGQRMDRLARIARNGDQLVLLDVHGNELARLHQFEQPVPALGPQ